MCLLINSNIIIVTIQTPSIDHNHKEWHGSPWWWWSSIIVIVTPFVNSSAVQINITPPRRNLQNYTKCISQIATVKCKANTTTCLLIFIYRDYSKSIWKNWHGDCDRLIVPVFNRFYREQKSKTRLLSRLYLTHKECLAGVCLQFGRIYIVAIHITSLFIRYM